MKKILANIAVLSEAEIQAIHKATLRTLEKVGIKIPNKECLAICKKLGAKVSEQDDNS